VLFGEPFGRVAIALLVHLGLVLTQLGIAGQLDVRTGLEFGLVSLLTLGGQLTIAGSAVVLRRLGEEADREASAMAAMRVARQSAEQVRRDHERRYDELRVTTVPLLEGLRSGRLSPADPDVQRRCAIEAARLRRLMAESDDTADPLRHELAECVGIAERAGVRVEVSYRGDGCRPDRSARRALTEPVIAVLAAARSHARLTVVRTAVDVLISVVADVGPATGPDPPADTGVEITELRDGVLMWMTAGWAE
jgi:hypothetical protein